MLGDSPCRYLSTGRDSPQMHGRQCRSCGLQAGIKTTDCRDKEVEDALGYCLHFRGPAKKSVIFWFCLIFFGKKLIYRDLFLFYLCNFDISVSLLNGLYRKQDSKTKAPQFLISVEASLLLVIIVL